MITINREKGWIILSRCEYLYRDGLENRDEVANREMGDGDIVIPLPDHMMSKKWDDRDDGRGRVKGSDGQGAEIIIAEIIKRLGASGRGPTTDGQGLNAELAIRLRDGYRAMAEQAREDAEDAKRADHPHDYSRKYMAHICWSKIADDLEALCPT